ncbi:MAG: hypothetical protein RIQ99_810, partial [Pseudomonadota bacterium]
MPAPDFRIEERIGLGIALIAHAVLFAWLAWQRPAPPPLPPERMTVTLSDQIGLTSGAPNPTPPAPEPAPDQGPELGEPAPSAQSVSQAAPTKPSPAPVKPTAAAKTPVALPAKPAQLAPKAPAAAAKAAAKPPAKAGASSFDQAFAKGVPGAQGKAPAPLPPAVVFSPQQQSALRAAIMRQIKPRWVAPQG